MTQKGLRHIALKSRDLKKTEEFYIGVLGCKVAFRHPPSMIFLTTPGSGDLLNFVKELRAHIRATRLGAYRLQDDARRSSREWKELSKSETSKSPSRRGKDAFYFFDPNGYQIEYYCD